MNRDQQLALLNELYERRSIVVEGRFSSTLSKADKSAAWQELWRWCAINGYSFVRADRNFTHLRDTVWAYIKRELKVRLCAKLSEL